MAAVVGVRFKNAGKLYYFDPGKHWPMAGSFVIVETARGLEYGQVITGVREVDDSLIASPLKPVVRVATEEDAQHAIENEKFEKEAYAVCQRKIDEHQLEMKLVGVEQTFDNTKILFYFTANGRVDFRALVKDLAAVFHTRIELRQIGVRDEAKMLGGLGPCGRPLCCGTFLGDFQPVSIKMAKEQNLSLNPTKISGVCGRLMCCLKYEQDHYEATRKRMPKIGKEVETPEGFGTVMDLNILKETVTVRIFKGDSSEMKTFPVDDLKWIRPTPPQEKKAEGEGKPTRRRSERPALSSTPMEQAEAVAEASDEIEEAMEPVHQDNDWRRAVEEALNAAQKKM
ncbi:MAG: stage 0 sporulation family protein [Clostridia bacterium]|nr:stage 0 sporulation family protein [Clostridia bacterium]